MERLNPEFAMPPNVSIVPFRPPAYSEIEWREACEVNPDPRTLVPEGMGSMEDLVRRQAEQGRHCQEFQASLSGIEQEACSLLFCLPWSLCL